MPSRRHKEPPTPWQGAKPAIATALASALGARGFGGPTKAMTFWRRRETFLDVVQLRSKYGVECYAHLGCHPIGVRESVRNEVACIFRTSASTIFQLPIEDAAIPSFVQRELVPAINRVVDKWFPLFSSLEDALDMLENQTLDVAYFNKGSPAYEDAFRELTECIRRKTGERK